MKNCRKEPSFEEGFLLFIKCPYVCLGLLFFFLGCSPNQKPNSANNRLDGFNILSAHDDKVQSDQRVILNSKDIIPEIGVASELLQKRKYIKLLTPENIVIGEVSKVDFTTDLIIVMDNRISNNVFVFNRDGQFQFLLGKKGTGPGEHLDPVDFFIKENSIFLIDQRYTLYEYSLENKFLAKLELPVSTNSFFVFDDLTKIFTSNEFEPHEIAYGLVQIDKEDIQPRFKKNLFPSLNRYTSSPIGYNTSIHKNSFLYFRSHGTKIYQVYEKGLVLRYQVVDQDTLPQEILKEEHRLVNEKYDYTWIYNWPILETKDLTQVRLMHGGIITIFYDKQNGRMRSFSGIEDDLLFGAIQDFPIHSSNDKFYIPLNVEQLYFAKTQLNKVVDKEVLQSLKENKSEFLNLIEDIDDLSNPILLECEIF